MEISISLYIFNKAYPPYPHKPFSSSKYYHYYLYFIIGVINNTIKIVQI
jgi:hypothetical protein